MSKAEDFFKREYQKLYIHSTEEEIELLRGVYKTSILLEPFKNCSAWAELMIWELHKMQRGEARRWKDRGRREKRILKMCLGWLRRVGVTDIDYDVVMPVYWEDIALLLYLDGNWGLRRAFPTLTLAVLGDRGSEYDAPVKKMWGLKRKATLYDYNLQDGGYEFGDD